MTGMRERADAGGSNRNRARIWAASSHEVEIDRQGRMPIPARLRHFRQNQDEVLVHGAIDRVELWNPATWASGCSPRKLVAGRRGLISGGDDDDRLDPRTKRKDTRQDREHDDKDTQDALDHVLHLDRGAGRPFHPLPCWSSELHLPLDPPAEGLQMAQPFITSPCSTTRSSRCSHRSPPVWSSTHRGGGGQRRRCSRRTGRCGCSGLTVTRPRSSGPEASGPLGDR